jgi:hypothetical protein
MSNCYPDRKAFLDRFLFHPGAFAVQSTYNRSGIVGHSALLAVRRISKFRVLNVSFRIPLPWRKYDLAH